jgi:hypothetical protein
VTGGAYRIPREGETVAVTCWCEEDVVWLPTTEVVAGRTGSCGLPLCHAPKEKKKR